MVPDYYAILGIDSAADRAAIEVALSRSQPAWSSGTRNPKNKHTYQSYLDQIPAMRRALLGDPSARAVYDAELAASRREDREKRLDALQGLIRLRAAKGGLSVGDRGLLRDRAEALGIPGEDLDRLIAPIPPRPEPPAEVDAADPPVDAVDPATRRQIRVALDHLGRRDLYDALGLDRDTPAAEVSRRADELRKLWMQKSQVTAEKTAWLEIIAYAHSHLAAPAARARYDRTLAVEAEEAFGESVAFALEGLPRLDPGTRNVLASEAASLGIEPDRADRLVARACRSLGVARDAPPPPAAGPGPPRLLRCRACGGVTDHARAAADPDRPGPCVHCGASLKWSCPVCQRSRWADEPRCACGFARALREPLVARFEAAQHAFKMRDYAAALEMLARVQDLAPNHVGARKGIEKVRQQIGAVEQARVAWQAARAARRYVGGRKAVAAWGKLVEPTDPDFQAACAELTKVLHDARVLADRGRRLESADPGAARASYRQALGLVADLPDARDGLGRCPPDPPTNLRVEVVDSGVRLRWDPPPADGLGPLRFLIRRVRPASSANGRASSPEAAVEVDATSYEDVGVEPGEAVSYSVSSLRGAARSLTAATAGPVLVLGGPRDVRVEARSGEVQLAWSLPPRALAARVVRKAGTPPAGPEDGDRVEATRDSAWDRGLADDRVYHYAIFAEYRGDDGAPVFSRPAVVAAAPHAPIAPVGPPRIAREPNGRVRLDWDAPPRGAVRIVRTPRPLAQSAGARVEPAEAEAIPGGIWLDVRSNDHAFDPDPPDAGLSHYTPIVSWAGMLTVGRPSAYSCIPDPSDLRAVRVGGAGRVHLRWRWAPRGVRSLVVYKSGSAPTGPDDPDAQAISVAEGDYGRQGYYALALPAGVPGPWHLAVFGVTAVDGHDVISPGLEPTARTVVPGPLPEVTVSYAIRRPGFPGRPWTLSVRTEPPGSAIPPLVLVARERAVPLSVDDGEIVARLPASRDGTTFPIATRVDLSRHRARVFPDPDTDPDVLSPIRFRHPESHGVRA